MNSDTSKFLDGYDRWYKNLPSPGGAADMNKSKGGKMKEWIERHKNCLKLATPNVPYDTPEKSLKLIAEIERLETELKQKEEKWHCCSLDWNQELDRANNEIKQLQAVCEAVEEYRQSKEKLIRNKTDENMINASVKYTFLMQALAAKGKDEKIP